MLLAKKRYVGFKYETPDEIEPVFDAKGIETVRRDGVLAQRKMTETCIKCVVFCDEMVPSLNHTLGSCLGPKILAGLNSTVILPGRKFWKIGHRSRILFLQRKFDWELIATRVPHPQVPWLLPSAEQLTRTTKLSMAIGSHT